MQSEKKIESKWARSYGLKACFLNPGADRKAWIQERVKAGGIIGLWEGGRLNLFLDPAASAHRLDRWTREGFSIRSPMEIPPVETVWQALSYFGEGEMDVLFIGDWYVEFPKRAHAILRSLHASVQSIDGLSPDANDLDPPVLDLAQEDDPFLINLWGKHLALCGRVGDAGRAFSKAAELDREFSDPYGNLGVLMWKAGQRREAFLLFAESLLKNPSNISASLNFFDAGYELEEHAAMAKVLEQIISEVVACPEHRHHLAICYQKMGKTKEALAVLQKILDLSPEDQEARALSERLASQQEHPRSLPS